MDNYIQYFHNQRTSKKVIKCSTQQMVVHKLVYQFNNVLLFILKTVDLYKCMKFKQKDVNQIQNNNGIKKMRMEIFCSLQICFKNTKNRILIACIYQEFMKEVIQHKKDFTRILQQQFQDNNHIKNLDLQKISIILLKKPKNKELKLSQTV